MNGHGEKNYLSEAMEAATERLKVELKAAFEQEQKIPHDITAKEFWYNFRRLCCAQGNCEVCPVHSACSSYTVMLKLFKNMESVIETVEQWAKEHPEKKRKSYAQDFFEKFPKAEPKYYDGRGKEQMIPIPCRQHCYGVVGRKCNGIGCSCSACWNEEMEGEDE